MGMLFYLFMYLFCIGKAGTGEEGVRDGRRDEGKRYSTPLKHVHCHEVEMKCRFVEPEFMK